MKKLFLFLITTIFLISCNDDNNYYVDYSKKINVVEYSINPIYGFNSAEVYFKIQNNSDKNHKIQIEYDVINFLNVNIGNYKTDEIDVFPFSSKDYQYNIFSIHQNKELSIKYIKIKILTTY